MMMQTAQSIAACLLIALAAPSAAESEVFRLFYRFGFSDGLIGDPDGGPSQIDVEALICATNDFLSDSMRNHTKNDAVRIFATEIDWGIDDWIYDGSEPEAPKNVPIIVNFTAVVTTNDGSGAPSHSDFWEATKYFDYFSYVMNYVWKIPGGNFFVDTRGMWYEPSIEAAVPGKLQESPQCPGAPAKDNAPERDIEQTTPSPTRSPTTPSPTQQDEPIVPNPPAAPTAAEPLSTANAPVAPSPTAAPTTPELEAAPDSSPAISATETPVSTTTPETPLPTSDTPYSPPPTPAPETPGPTTTPETPRPTNTTPDSPPPTFAPETPGPTIAPETPLPTTSTQDTPPPTSAPETPGPTTTPETPLPTTIAPTTDTPTVGSGHPSATPTTNSPTERPTEAPITTAPETPIPTIVPATPLPTEEIPSATKAPQEIRPTNRPLASIPGDPFGGGGSMRPPREPGREPESLGGGNLRPAAEEPATTPSPVATAPPIEAPPITEQPAFAAPVGDDNDRTVAPTTAEEEMVYFRIEMAFFDGVDKNPSTDDVTNMICQVNKFFEESLREDRKDPKLISYATNIDWDYESDEDLPFSMLFTSHTIDGEGQVVPAREVYDYILSSADAKLLITDYIWLSEAYTSNQFYNTEDLALAGKYSGSLNPPKKRLPPISPGKLAQATCP